jgi:hypothetical protein
MAVLAPRFKAVATSCDKASSRGATLRHERLAKPKQSVVKWLARIAIVKKVPIPMWNGSISAS